MNPFIVFAQRKRGDAHNGPANSDCGLFELKSGWTMAALEVGKEGNGISLLQAIHRGTTVRIIVKEHHHTKAQAHSSPADPSRPGPARNPTSTSHHAVFCNPQACARMPYRARLPFWLVPQLTALLGSLFSLFPLFPLFAIVHTFVCFVG